jgi:small GTP-binding protein
MNYNDDINCQMAHFNKINIFGCSKVGKLSLILSIEKYLEKDFKLEEKKEKYQEELAENNENKETVNPPKLTEQIKRINISYNESTELFLDLYETNIDNMDFLKDNIDTLITYSECLIFMIDITKINSFNEISKLLPLILESYKGKNTPPMILLSNKNDLESSREVSGFEIKEFIDQYQNMINIELSLLDKDSFKEFIQKFVEILEREEKKEVYDHIHLVKIKHPPQIIKNPNENNTNLEEISLNLFLLGSSTVGKTSFIKKFLKFEYFENSLSTLGIDVEKFLAKVENNLVKVELWDTAGQERLRSIPKKYYSKGDGFLLLYDVTNASTFEDVTGWIKDIREARGTFDTNGVNNTKTSNEVLFLIGNKIDETKKRIVKKEDAKNLAEKYGVSYFEVSCKDGVNVYEVLSKLIFEAFSMSRGNNQHFKLSENNKNKSKKKKCC